MPYLGASPRNINTRSVIDHQEYLGSQADTSTNSGYYTFYVNYTPGNVSVVVRGVHMASSDYTATNGTDVRISTSTITLANDDVIEIIGYGIPSSQILERSDVNITGGQAINLTQVGASSYKVGNTEVIDSSGNLISGTLGANVSFANIADDAISGDKIHSGTISSSTLDGIKLKSSGNSITASDGTTAVLSESGGVVTLNNGTIGSGVVFPAGKLINYDLQIISSTISLTTSDDTPEISSATAVSITLPAGSSAIISAIGGKLFGSATTNRYISVSLISYTTDGTTPSASSNLIYGSEASLASPDNTTYFGGAVEGVVNNTTGSDQTLKWNWGVVGHPSYAGRWDAETGPRASISLKTLIFKN
jgi:hypothetical protein